MTDVMPNLAGRELDAALIKLTENLAATPNPERAAHAARPATAPAYYLGRPASVYLAVFHRANGRQQGRVNRKS
jgi:hypothetical protein